VGPGPIWTDPASLASIGILSQDRPARSEPCLSASVNSSDRVGDTVPDETWSCLKGGKFLDKLRDFMESVMICCVAVAVGDTARRTVLYRPVQVL
jgi:hypothetical protein